MRDPAWAEQLGVFIREVAEFSAHLQYSRKGFGLEIDESPEELAVELTELLNRKRLRKDEALQLLRKVSGSKKWKPRESQTLRENCLALLSTVSSHDDARLIVEKVANLLGVEMDPYLKGLS
jgi:hypothetical protein